VTSSNFVFGFGVKLRVIESLKGQPSTEHLLRVAVFNAAGEK